MKHGVFFFQTGQKVDRETFSTLTSHFPNLVKVATIAEVLSHCNCQVQVQDSMPPEPRHEDGLSWMLDPLNNRMELITAMGPFFIFKSGQNFVKILDRFIVFSLFP